MSDHDSHCPFLNRSDSRCATHFALDRLGSAFDDCFGSYHSCATYRELLVERLAQHPGHDGQLSHVPISRPIVYTNLTIRNRSANVTVHAHASAA